VRFNPLAVLSMVAVAGIAGGGYIAPASRGFLAPMPKLGSGGGKSRARRQREARARGKRRAARTRSPQ
jgi:hypothetical protein